MLADIAVDHVNDEVTKFRTVWNGKLVAIEMQEVVGSFECRPLVALQKRMIAPNTDQQRDGKFDLSVIAPEGPSAALYLTHHQLLGLALDLLAKYAMESGVEIGEAVEERRRGA